MCPGNAIETSQMPLGLVPEIFDATDVIFAIGKQHRMADPVVLKGGNIEHIIGGKRVRIHNAVGHDFFLYDGLQGGTLHVADHLGVDLATTLQ